MTQEPDHSQDPEEQGLTEDTLVLDFLDQAGVTERLSRPGTQDVAINRPFEIWVDGPDGWVREDAPWLTYSLCWRLANALCALNYRVLAPHSPIHTVKLPGGERGQIVMAPACEEGTLSMTFRKPSLLRFTHKDYVNSGRYDRAQAIASPVLTLKPWQCDMKDAHAAGDWDPFMETAVAHLQNIIVFGGPGSGKTTYGKTLIDLFPAHRRMVTIQEMLEDTLPFHPNHVHLHYGHVVGPKALVASALRMKPDHLFLAELTGDEVWHYMEILNTGTKGTVTTAHANDSEAGYARVCGLVKQSEVGKGLDYAYIERLVRTSFDVVVYMEKQDILEVHYEPENKLALLNGQRQRAK
ncbi:P-type DNA transfer ATPase VirB11 [Pseudomonas savastanoi]|uniref:Type IV secretion system protein n=1 Tax=Pseudomonas savastanoi TaxID=29438 RepID=A0AAW5J9Z0_PSESS|nr:P-type DNA transfer ATPase VirB11 [Pseudomonas savastanoi]MCQ3023196.1 P-type DNA transfer ATPase VirB11 [Pseudomonas savastanoi]